MERRRFAQLARIRVSSLARVSLIKLSMALPKPVESMIEIVSTPTNRAVLVG